MRSTTLQAANRPNEGTRPQSGASATTSIHNRVSGFVVAQAYTNPANLAVLVMTPLVTGTFRIDVSGSATIVGAPTLNLNLLTGAFTVNGVAPVSGTFTSTAAAGGVTLAGGASSTIMTSPGNAQTPQYIALGGFFVTGVAIGTVFGIALNMNAGAVTATALGLTVSAIEIG